MSWVKGVIVGLGDKLAVQYRNICLTTFFLHRDRNNLIRQKDVDPKQCFFVHFEHSIRLEYISPINFQKNDFFEKNRKLLQICCSFFLQILTNPLYGLVNSRLDSFQPRGVEQGRGYFPEK